MIEDGAGQIQLILLHIVVRSDVPGFALVGNPYFYIIGPIGIFLTFLFPDE